MKIYLLTFAFSLFGIAHSQHMDREIFEQTLGEEKALAYAILEESFETFLALNYRQYTSLSDQIKHYLIDIDNQSHSWTYDDSLSRSTLQRLEQSGLRKDIMLYRKEKYHERFDFESNVKIETSSIAIDDDDINDDFEDLLSTAPTTNKENRLMRKNEKKRQKQRDKFPAANKNGRFYYALARAQTNHDDINHYVHLITALEVQPSPSLMASGFLKNLADEDLVEWENRMLLIVEVYLNSLIYQKLMGT